jgi:RNA polymerase sigma factor (sigma-70 family)
MGSTCLRTFLRRLRRDLGPEVDGGVSDSLLLQRFLTQRDETAFEVLVWRHAGLVLEVCSRCLLQSQDTEDVFQATFLALARKAGSIRNGQALGGWLARIASRVVLRLRTRSAREVSSSTIPDPVAPAAGDPAVDSDLRRLLHEEIRRLPEPYRVPVVLCYLEGRTTQEAAQQIGCARGTICSRLSWARQQLRARLSRRGLAISTALLSTALLPRSASAGLVRATVQAALTFTTNAGAARILSGRAVTLAEGVLQTMLFTRVSLTAVLVLLLGVLGVGVGLCRPGGPGDKVGPGETPQLIPSRGDAVRLPANHPIRAGLPLAEAVARIPEPRVLRLPGSLALDPQGLARVRCRFSQAEVIETPRELRPGDRVRKGEVLAVVHSKEVGAKQIELLNAIVQLALDQDMVERLEKSADAVPEVFLLNARRNVVAARTAVARIRNVLAAWNLPEEEIKAVEAEAERILKTKGNRDSGGEKQWGRTSLLAPMDGTLIERNVALHEVIVDNSVSLFTIAHLDRLQVMVQVSETDLPVLESLPAEMRRWTIQPSGMDAPEIQGRIDSIGYLIDPNLHTATATGTVDNKQGLLRPGQYITATIRLPRNPDEVVVSATAVVEAEGRHYVFVQPDVNQPVYEQRRVVVVRRGADVVHIRFRLSPDQEGQGFQVVRPGEHIVTARVTDMKAILDDLKRNTNR